MALALGVEETEHSFEDVLLQQAAMAEELPPDTALVEYGKLKVRGRVQSCGMTRCRMLSASTLTQSKSSSISFVKWIRGETAR